jgi:hypothetical protein
MTPWRSARNSQHQQAKERETEATTSLWSDACTSQTFLLGWKTFFLEPADSRTKGTDYGDRMAA